MDLLKLRSATLLLLVAGAAGADLLSPGPLAKAHAKLEGIQNCTQCHVKGGQVSEQRCLDCHTELKDRVAKKQGFHGRLTPAQLSCNGCHHDHQGRDFHLVEWPPGGQKSFDHRKTGFAIEGKHARLDCEQCHVKKLIVDGSVRTLLAEQPARSTFLGLGTQCTQCHFDEHRGQLAGACTTCHTQNAWKPVPGFSHAKTDFPLKGKHASVECLKCHANTMDAESHKEAALQPRSEVFSRMRPVAHGSCVDCHKDPHEGRLGADCTACHAETGWKEVHGTSAERAFHEKTRYPLRGAHAQVACRSCHGPFPGVKAVFKGLRFDTCATCHVDAHLAQLGSPPKACDTCHDLQRFLPARYDPATHRSYPLEGGHAVVACSGCHKTDPALSEKASVVRSWIAARRRNDQVSLTQFHPSAPTGRCDSCHTDAHRGQFAARVKKSGCGDCHEVKSFHAVRFDHDRESRFALTGAHVKAACAACHTASAGVVQYKPVDTACASCHADPHAGQFAKAAARSDCAACHGTGDWKKTTFVHKPPFTSYELDGKHAQVACASCHRQVSARGAQVTQYRGLPVTCAGCHVDVHQGAFRELAK